MKKALIWIASAIVLVGIIAGASALYSSLSDEYKNDGIEEIESPKDNENTSQDNGEDKNNEDENTESNDNSESGNNSESYSNPAPDFTVLDKNGKEVKLSDMKGKPVVINFWATWCPYCIEEMPDFEAAYNKYKDRISFMMLNMTDRTETIDKASSFIDGNGYTFPVYFDADQEATYAYSVSAPPVTYFIDSEGNLRAYGMGMLDMAAIERGIEMIIDK